ncbi:MAG TPA: hydroxysqualene dehydroxylase HpnE [Bryobacteraceae bacterium]|nr:hydroxysqualene dehydroxylase HpnE [Bryobacteraceae bacterium]
MEPSSQIAVVGGGLAGLAAALALGSAGRQVKVFEARPFLGGRATSYPLNTADDESPTIDNCQHVLLRCCTNLMDFYDRLGVADRIHFYREFYWIEPGGRMSVMRRGLLPAPLHFTESFATLKFLSIGDRLGIGRALLSVPREYRTRKDLDRVTMMDWLREKKQGAGAIERFWRQILVSAISEDLERMAAIHGLQVFAVGFLSSASAYEMGVPNVPLADLYGAEAWARYPQVEFAYRSNVQRVHIEDARFAGLVVNGDCIPAAACVLAVPFEKITAIAPDLALNLAPFTHSPITGIHLWFDRPITDLPHATLLDRTIQWMYNKEAGRHIQLVVSASRSLVEMGRAEVIEMALRELKEFFPKASEAALERAHVVKEVRAIFSAVPGLETVRPESRTAVANLYLAGDWTRSGWPATMEGAVRSGYLAAEALLEAQGEAAKFLLPDVA